MLRPPPPDPGYLFSTTLLDSVRESLLRKEEFLKAKIENVTISSTPTLNKEKILADLCAELRSVQQAMENRRTSTHPPSSETFAGPTDPCARLPSSPLPPLISIRDSLVRKAEFLTTKIDEYHEEMFGREQRALVEMRAYSGAPVDVSKLKGP